MVDIDIDKYIYNIKTELGAVIQDLYKKKIDICLVCDQDNKLVGILTLGDIKKAIVGGYDPDEPIINIMTKKFTCVQEGATKKELEQASNLSSGRRKIPIISKFGRVVDLYPNEIDNKLIHKRVLVTGGAGYVGSIVCHKLIEKGYKVTALDNLSFGKESIVDLLQNKNFELIVGDINNISHLIQGVKNADHVIHLAGTVGDPASAFDPSYTMESNYFSTQALIEVSKYYQVSHFVFASSCSVYGAGDDILTEESSLNPVSLYARTKIAGEKKLIENSSQNFNPVILRFGTLYGLSPRMRFDLVANTMSAHAFFLKKIIVQGGDQWRPLLHVRDAAKACVEILEKPISLVKGEIFNVGSSKENYQIKDIADSIASYLPKVKINNKETSDDPRNYRVLFDKISQKLNFHPDYTLKQGVGEIIKSMRSGRFKNYQESKYNNYLSRKQM